ncbi:aryl-alcohol dehydrogenase [Endobacter medicaginis]|uniref:Aryl-alcohol dehydrogenase n=1 Tax=Endobacter medicaginis TaxID=1181271 RepID=A0A839V468_9PROT|nr:NAD(P)-dependent alcohol dehydrogenase [Endobacter medicaginis]MBB3175350.1 aryl-alcohol dehydrogenase [Endobacter medicaginis]MCX5476530.1 NAD(P)-dependent alcohol dehydrogenase [Endobacter medicaginis]NVN29187.1 NAD(P)-dependent alcohol dehydrogenase [Endobacter medicaginis]
MGLMDAAVVREKGGHFVIEKVRIEEPREDEVLVRIAGVGMCHTDLVVRDQYFPTPLPAILGHEGAGVVTKVGSKVTKVAVGDHVVLSFASCGKCANCLSGKPGYCPELYARNFSGGRPDGSSPCCDAHGQALSACFFSQSSFGQLAMATERNVVRIPKDVPVEIMGPLGCGIQTGAGAVMNALKPEAGSSIAIFGAGSVGLSAVMAARVVGCATIVVVDLNDDRLALAKELGATHTINGGKGDTVAAIQEVTGGEGVQYSLECTGLPKVVRQAVDALRLTGVCGTIGVAPLGTEVALDMNTILFGRTVRGIIEGDSVPDIFIPRLVALWQQGRFPFDKLIRKYKLSEIDTAAHESEIGAVLKAVLIPDPV